MRLVVRVALVVVAAMGVVALFVIPARTFVGQSHSLSLTEHRIAVLSEENARLRAEARQLQTDATVEQIARSEYGLVMPGERAYALIPGAAPTASGR